MLIGFLSHWKKIATNIVVDFPYFNMQNVNDAKQKQNSNKEKNKSKFQRLLQIRVYQKKLILLFEATTNKQK